MIRGCAKTTFLGGESVPLFFDVNPLMDLHPIQEGPLYHQALHHATDKLRLFGSHNSCTLLSFNSTLNLIIFNIVAFSI